MGRGQPPTAPPGPTFLSGSPETLPQIHPELRSGVCAVPCSSLKKGDVKNERGPEATLTIEALGTTQ